MKRKLQVSTTKTIRVDYEMEIDEEDLDSIIDDIENELLDFSDYGDVINEDDVDEYAFLVYDIENDKELYRK